MLFTLRSVLESRNKEYDTYNDSSNQIFTHISLNETLAINGTIDLLIHLITQLSIEENDNLSFSQMYFRLCMNNCFAIILLITQSKNTLFLNCITSEVVSILVKSILLNCPAAVYCIDSMD